MKRPEFLPLALLIAAGCSEPSEPEVSGPKNVVLISIDTLRPDRLGLHGYERGITPTLDHVGEEGVVFERTIAQAPWTAPSHASMLTSLYPSRLNMGKFSQPGIVSPAAETLAETLQSAGFQTAAVTGGGFVSRELGFAQGFDLFTNHKFMRDNVTTAIRWMDTLKEDQHFFLFLHTYEVHHYIPHAEFKEKWVGEYDGPVAEARNVAKLVQDYTNREKVEKFTDEDWTYVKDLYDACLASVDSQIQVLIDYLDAKGLREDTLIVITSDHGEEFGEHGYSGHGYTLYDENVHVPLIFNHSSLNPARVPSQVRVLDVAPTILDLMKVEQPKIYQGVSLIPWMNGAENRLVAYSENAHSPLKSVRTEHHKLIVSIQAPKTRLFDLLKDPSENANLSEDPPGKMETAMKKGMLMWVRRNAAGRLKEIKASAMSKQMREQLEELGYLGNSGGVPVIEAKAWIEVLKTDTK